MSSLPLTLVRKPALAAALGLWGLATVVPLSFLMASHDLPLPTGPIRAATPIAGRDIQTHKWRLIHVLAEGCPCSATVGRALATRGPQQGVDETVVVAQVGKAKSATLQRQLAAAGFAAQTALPADVADQVSVEGGPWLVIVDPAGRVAYSGGYAAQRPRDGVPLQDASIVDRLRHGETVAALPAFGCATSRSLQQAIDPLGLKY